MSFGSIYDILTVGIERLTRTESKWSLKGNRMNLEEKEVRHQERRSAWCGVQGGQGECWCWWRSAECYRGEQRRAKECWQGWRSAYPAKQPSMLSIAESGGTYRVRNQIEALLIEVGEGIEERWLTCRSANPDWGGPTGFEEHVFLRRSPIGGGGGVWCSPPCGIDE